MSNFFSAPPAAPTLQSYQQPSISDALSQYLGQSSQLPQLQSMANTMNQGANSAYQSMLFGSTPGLQQNISQFGQNTSSLLQGQLPADVQTQVQNSAAYSALTGGFGGSNMAHALTARDLGQTSLSLQQQGAQNLGQQTSIAQALNPTNVTTSGMVYSPQTILSSDQQAALINNQITNQNEEIGYQNQLQADKGSPFMQTLTNNLASLVGTVTNPSTLLTGASNGAYSGNTYDGISSGGMASTGTYAVGPSGQNVGQPTPGSSSGSGMGGIASMLSVCCWIFLEQFHGKLPWWVRECRDEFAPENTARRIGYRQMAWWLVPAMQRSEIVRFLVWILMVWPMTIWGGWYKKVPGYEWGWVCRPFVSFWFATWELIGEGEDLCQIKSPIHLEGK